MNAFEIIFAQAGNTVVGDYAVAEKLYNTKPSMFPNGWTITAETDQDSKRLIEYVQLFHNCLKTVKAWQKAVGLAGCFMAVTG